jgi:hypothetical protein
LHRKYLHISTTAGLKAASLIEKETLAMFHMSAASGLKSGQSDQERNYAILA